jgi:hypothetical protein
LKLIHLAAWLAVNSSNVVNTEHQIIYEHACQDLQEQTLLVKNAVP